MIAKNDHMSKLPGPRFPLGQVVATPDALFAMAEADQDPKNFIRRHVAGDWGEMPPEDAEENERSVAEGYRLMSAYTLKTGTKIWIITEADRSVTTILLPENY